MENDALIGAFPNTVKVFESLRTHWSTVSEISLKAKIMYCEALEELQRLKDAGKAEFTMASVNDKPFCHVWRKV